MKVHILHTQHYIIKCAITRDDDDDVVRVRINYSTVWYRTRHERDYARTHMVPNNARQPEHV